MLLLSDRCAWTAADLVQILCLSFARRKRSQIRFGGFWRRVARRDRDSRLGFNGRDALYRRAYASRWNRRLERSAACRVDHARLHDRRRRSEKAKRGGVMDGVHDMGGMDGFGKVEPEPNEPVFHQRWEGRVMAMSRALGASGTWTIDHSRDGIERLPPHVYLTS